MAERIDLAPILRVRKAILLRVMVGGTLEAIARFCWMLAAVCLTLWTYSLWGSHESPLKYLLTPAIVILILGFICRFILISINNWLARAARVEHRCLSTPQASTKTDEPNSGAPQ